MNAFTTLSVYRGMPVLGIVALGGIAALTISQQTQRFAHVCALVDGQSGVDGVSQVASMEFANDRVYLSSQLDNCLTVLSRSEDGSLTIVEHIAREAYSPVPVGSKLIPSDRIDRMGQGTVRVTNDHRFLFLANGNNILLFESGADRVLTLSAIYGDTPFTNPNSAMLDFAVSPDERFLFCNRLRDGAVEVLAFDRNAKQLTRVQDLSGLGRCEDLATSPDGRHLYAASRTNRLLYVFSIDVDSGKLTKLREMTDEDCGKRKLKMVTALRVAPDGAQAVMTCLPNEGFVVVFNRDSMTGELRLAQTFNKEVSGIADLNYPVNIAFSPDSKTLFIGCSESQCVVVFRKKDRSEEFSYLETIKHPTIQRPSCLEVDGGFLYVCSREAGAVSVFRINDDKEKPEKEVTDSKEKKE